MTMSRFRSPLAAVALGALLALHPTSARAEDVQRAKILFDAGSQAYDAGRFAVAAQAFAEAYAAAPRPALLFSLAQAERRQYTADHQREYLRDAIGHFREYLGAVQQGGRRTDAVEALAELEALAGREDRDGTRVNDAPRKQTTRIMISSNVKEAQITIDGKLHTDVPVIEEVAPGKHTVRVTAPGYADEDREVTGVDGYLVAAEVDLKERPSNLVLGAPSGADIAIDGRPYGQAPLAPIALPSGAHLVTVTKTGRRPYLGSVKLGRGESLPLTIALPNTPQRSVSYGLMTVSLVSLASGAGLSAGALERENAARTIQSTAQRQNITASQLGDYNHALDQRDALRTASYITFGAAAAVGLVASALFLFDHEAVTRGAEAPATAGGQISLLPAVLHGGGGALVTGTF